MYSTSLEAGACPEADEAYWRKLLREASNTRGEQKNSTPQHEKHEQ